MNKICTDIHQSKTLLELGINVNTADMYWSLVNKNHPPIVGKYCAEYGGMQLPAWSLSALLELMPKEEDDDLDLCYGAYKGGDGEYVAMWACSCNNYFDFGDTSIDAVFNVVCWLLESKKI